MIEYKTRGMSFSFADGIRKIWRFSRMYGFGRTWFKVAARRRGSLPITFRARDDADIAMVGCGQYAFATMGYYISRLHGARFRWCYDPDDRAAEGFRRGFRVKHKAVHPNEWLEDAGVRTVYIASNHNSHTDYACAALNRGRTVYLEKPVSVTEEQLAKLESARLHAEADGKRRLFAGYNRPFAEAIGDIKTATLGQGGSISLSCFVSGHKIGKEHWYRKPEEGTRICGNAGHWIDLFVHLCASRNGPSADEYRIVLLSADPKNADDDFALSIATDRGDIFSMMMTARTEPFEGINETINFQQGNVIAKVDDFRYLTLWRDTTLLQKRYWPKDAGHARAILQPIDTSSERAWAEVRDSTVLMLAVTDMVRQGRSNQTLSLTREYERIFSASGLVSTVTH